VVHEFTSHDEADRGYRGTRRDPLDENAKALRTLIRLLGGDPHQSLSKLHGRFKAVGCGCVKPGFPFFVGKASRHIDPFGG